MVILVCVMMNIFCVNVVLWFGLLSEFEGGVVDFVIVGLVLIGIGEVFGIIFVVYGVGGLFGKDYYEVLWMFVNEGLVVGVYEVVISLK